MAKQLTIFFCSSCGNEFTKWAGQCPACKQWNTLTQADSFLNTKTNRKSSTKEANTLSPSEALTHANKHIFNTGINELDRVLGPGITNGGVYLISGQPGIGKSTLLTQLAIKLEKNTVFYTCSEENPAQVATRIKRLSEDTNKHIELINSSEVEAIIKTATRHKNDLPPVLIVDSIQSVYSASNGTTPGSMTQIRDSANILIRNAKENDLPTIIVGHVTKQGNLAGPKLLEHMVDAVLDFTGDRQHELRLLKSVKNRFGPTDETGIFQMEGKGLIEVPDPSKLLLTDTSKGQAGSALALVMEGTRPMTIEIQALVTSTPIPIPRRIANGIPTNKLQLITAILNKHLNLKLAEKDVYLNVTSGYKVTDPAADLAIALAIISSAKNKPIPKGTVSFGEVGLLSEIRPVAFQDKRIKEARALGYKNIISQEKFKKLTSTLL
jgi:DNA repair protein RadA/Sms